MLIPPFPLSSLELNNVEFDGYNQDCLLLLNSGICFRQDDNDKQDMIPFD